MPLRFEALPAGRDAGRAWAEEAEQLRSRPNEWARIATKDSRTKGSNLARAIRSGVMVSFRPAGHFEAVARGKDVWVRYVGDGKPGAE